MMKCIECVPIRRANSVSCSAANVAFVAMRSVGVVPGVKTDVQRSDRKVAMTLGGCSHTDCSPCVTHSSCDCSGLALLGCGDSVMVSKLRTTTWPSCLLQRYARPGRIGMSVIVKMSTMSCLNEPSLNAALSTMQFSIARINTEVVKIIATRTGPVWASDRREHDNRATRRHGNI